MIDERLWNIEEFAKFVGIAVGSAYHLVTLEEEKRLLAVASPRLRVLIMLDVETGMRPGEMLQLQWKHVDLLKDEVQVRHSKSPDGIRPVKISPSCRGELIRWRNLLGRGFSEWVFPSFENRRHRLQQGGRKAWANTLKKAGLPYFPIYYLRHTFATRLTTLGVSQLTIAQMLGHSSTQIVARYAQVIDQNRIDAMKKLEDWKKAAITSQQAAEADADDAVEGMRQ